MGYNHENWLSVSYDIPESGIRERDMMIIEIAGPEAKNTDWGSMLFPCQTYSNGFSYPTREAMLQAVERFKVYPELRCYYE